MRTFYSLAITVMLGCTSNPDMDTALAAGVGRTLTTPPKTVPLALLDLAEATSGNDSVLARPISVAVCAGHMAVVDARRSIVAIFSTSGKLIKTLRGTDQQGHTSFAVPVAVRCSGDGLAVADNATRRVSQWGLDGTFRRELGDMRMPQGIPYPGDLAFSNEREWFDSWLGLRPRSGPVLSDIDWSGVHLVDRRIDSLNAGGFGAPRTYSDPVARRALNRTFLAATPSEVWVLTQGDAVVQRFTLSGQPAAKPIFLPVYQRGKDPIIKLGPVIDSASQLRRNKFVSQPSVAGIALLPGSRFAVIRYLDWHITYVGKFPSGSIEYRARSSVEIYNYAGRAVGAFTIPDFALEIASDPDTGAIAVLVQNRQRESRVLFGRIAKTDSCTGSAACALD